VNACDVFVYTENLAAEKKATTASRRPKSASSQAKEDADPIPLLTQAYEMAVREDGWARLDSMGSALYQLDPGFDPRSYGHKQLSRLISKFRDRFEMRTQEMDGSILMFVKMKE
jgi:hypothetical protein